jgi:ankyrin repeat protein
MIKLLLKQGASPNVNRDGTPLLLGAEENDDVELVKLLKKYGASREIPTDSMVSSESALNLDDLQLCSDSISTSKYLINAVDQIDVPRVKELVAGGADINYQDSSGNTALSLAVSAMAVDSISRRNRRSTCRTRCEFEPGGM